jgi:hypothetical protein
MSYPQDPVGQDASQSASPLNYATPVPPPIPVRQIAQQQRGIIYCILAEVVVMVLIATVGRSAPLLAFALDLAYLAIGITGAVFLFMLSISLYNTALGIILGILSLIPLLGLLILLMVNNKATTTLREHGVKVGLMGAKTATFPPDMRM